MASPKIKEGELYAQVVEKLNDILFDEGISISKVEGVKSVYIWLTCDQDRAETQEDIEHHLKSIKGVSVKRTNTNKSGFDTTEIVGENIFIVYKATKGGMAETTLNSSITELFPCIGFENPKTDHTLSINKFYNEICKKNNKDVGAYARNKNAGFKVGSEIVSKAEQSSQFETKVGNAKAFLGWLLHEDKKRKKIEKVVWGYRNNMKPEGVQPNHKGDIFIIYQDKGLKPNKKGISLKAGVLGAAEPQFNSYVSAIFNSAAFKTAQGAKVYKDLQKESYDSFYKKIPGMTLAFSQYGKQSMTKIVGEFEKSQRKQYEQYYDSQLEWLRDTVIDMMNDNQAEAKKWLIQEVAKDDPNVPLIVLKASGDKFPQDIHEIKDEDVIKNCVTTAKKGGVKAYKSTSSKQNWHIDLTCKTITTTLNFSIRTNKGGIQHKLGQYVNLAVKFNGIKK